MKPPLKVVHDTNVVRQALLHPDSETHWLYACWIQRLAIPVANKATLGELTDHLEKSTGAPYRSEAIRRAQIALTPYRRFITELQPYQPFPEAPRCAVPDYQKFIELAYASQSDCLLTQDQELLKLNGQTPFPMEIIYLFTH